MQRLSAQPADGGTNQQTTMDPDTTTAMTSFDLLGLPKELRDEIYESAIFDLRPPETGTIEREATTFTYRHMNTNILLTSRKIYWEARNMIVRRGRLVMVSATHLHNGFFEGAPIPVRILTGWIQVIHPKYRNLCIMNHHINATRSAFIPELEGSDKWEFILHQRDIENFCHCLMGNLDLVVELMLGPRATHNLVLHCPPSYAQHECTSVIEVQARVLQQYRRSLRGFEDISIRGTSTGWESGLYSATLRDMRSADARRELAGFIDGYMKNLRALEKELLETFSQTGDLAVANTSFDKALEILQNAKASFTSSFSPSLAGFNRTRLGSDTQNWAQLRRLHGNVCALPLVNFFYKLFRIRLSMRLRLIRRGGHLPKPPSDLGEDVHEGWRQSYKVNSFFNITDWLPQPSEEIQMCCAVAAALRLLDHQGRYRTAMEAIVRAIQLSPDDEAVEEEASRFNEWVARFLAAQDMVHLDITSLRSGRH